MKFMYVLLMASLLCISHAEVEEAEVSSLRFKEGEHYWLTREPWVIAFFMKSLQESVVTMEKDEMRKEGEAMMKRDLFNFWLAFYGPWSEPVSPAFRNEIDTWRMTFTKFALKNVSKDVLTSDPLNIRKFFADNADSLSSWDRALFNQKLFFGLRLSVLNSESDYDKLMLKYQNWIEGSISSNNREE